jgi:ribonuclease HI
MENGLKRLRELRDDLASGREPDGDAPAVLDWALARLDEKRARLFTDGGARGNPGPAAYGLVLYDADGNELLRRAKAIGRATNNVAEYAAVIAGLELARQFDFAGLDVYLDAQLVVRQLNGEYRTKDPRLAGLKARALTLAAKLPGVRFHFIPRGKNRLADSLVNAALDGRDPDTL